MKYLMIAALVFTACGSDEQKPDKPAVVAAKAQCKQVLTHIVQVSPQAAGRSVDEIVAGLPVEDLQSCVASEPEIRACMLTAADVAAVKKCLPSEEVLKCMRKANKARDKAREDAKKEDGDAALDAPFDAIRGKCYAGDPKAADVYGTD